MCIYHEIKMKIYEKAPEGPELRVGNFEGFSGAECLGVEQVPEMQRTLSFWGECGLFGVLAAGAPWCDEV